MGTKMLVFGDKELFLYDSEKEIWEELEGLGECVSGLGAAVRVGENMFILGVWKGTIAYVNRAGEYQSTLLPAARCRHGPV